MSWISKSFLVRHKGFKVRATASPEHNHKNPSEHNHEIHQSTTTKTHRSTTTKQSNPINPISQSNLVNRGVKDERESVTVREEQRRVIWGLGTAGSRGWELDDGWFGRGGVIWERKRDTDWEWFGRVNESWVIWERDRGTEWERERNDFLISGMNKINFFFLLSWTVHIKKKMCTVAVELKFLDLAPLLQQGFYVYRAKF